MGKKTIISSSVVALSLGLALGLFSVNAFATDETNKIQPRTAENDGIMLLEQCDGVPLVDGESSDGCVEVDESQENNDSEVIIVDDEDEVEEIEVETEPEMWPVYVSSGALGVMILMIIILNLTSKKK